MVFKSSYTSAIRIWILYSFACPQECKHTRQFPSHTRDLLGTKPTSGYPYRGLVQTHGGQGTSGSCSPNQGRTQLDRFHSTISERRHLAGRQIRGWKDKEKSASFLAIRGPKIVQALFFWAISTLCSPRSDIATPWGAAWWNLWKPHRRQIFVSQSHHSGLLMAKYAERSTRVCEEMWSVSKIYTKHTPAMRSSESPV